MVRANKELGQNFLNSPQAIEKLVACLNLVKDDVVVEIGPGLGAVTNNIIQRLGDSGLLYAIEFDPRLIRVLTNEYQDRENIKVVHANILDWLPEFDTPRFKLIGSLPYYITSPIIHRIIYMKQQPNMCSLLVQKEVAQKIAAEKDKTSYMSSFVQTFFDVEYVMTVERESFDPVPEVDGGIIRLTKKDSPFSKANEIKKWQGFLHKAYSNPRKMLNKVFSESELQRGEVSPDQRPQEVEVSQWLKVFTLQ